MPQPKNSQDRKIQQKSYSQFENDPNRAASKTKSQFLDWKKIKGMNLKEKDKPSVYEYNGLPEKKCNTDKKEINDQNHTLNEE